MNALKIFIFTTFCVVLLLLPMREAVAADYQVGVYYFPGWRDNTPHSPSNKPWDAIKKFPEKKPELGWYDEGDDRIMIRQLVWLKSYGLSFVVFDWYFSKNRQVMLEHALASFMRTPDHDPLKFSILWANHDGMPMARDDWRSMVGYWIKYYLNRSDYLVVDGKPVVFIFSADELKKQAEIFGATTAELLGIADSMAHDAGLKGIYFVAGTGANTPMISSYAKNAGYSAFSAYNYHSGPDAQHASHSYRELDFGYQQHWQRFAEVGNLPLIVPLTSGWDHRPWGASKDSEHDNSLSTPEEFSDHLKSAREFMKRHPALTNKMGVICCWNEFGEGSYIEPTKVYKMKYLEKVLDVFERQVK